MWWYGLVYTLYKIYINLLKSKFLFDGLNKILFGFWCCWTISVIFTCYSVATKKIYSQIHFPSFQRKMQSTLTWLLEYSLVTIFFFVLTTKRIIFFIVYLYTFYIMLCLFHWFWLEFDTRTLGKLSLFYFFYILNQQLFFSPSFKQKSFCMISVIFQESQT